MNRTVLAKKEIVKVRPSNKSTAAWPVAAGMLTGMIFLFLVGGVLLYLVTQAANRMTENAAGVAHSAVSAVGEILQQSVVLTLTEGNDEQRLEVLNQLSECDFSHPAQVPDDILCALYSNLDHENPEVRVAANRILEIFNQHLTSLSQ